MKDNQTPQSTFNEIRQDIIDVHMNTAKALFFEGTDEEQELELANQEADKVMSKIAALIKPSVATSSGAFDNKLFELIVGYGVPVNNQLELKTAITSLVLEERINELENTFVSYDNALASQLVKNPQWEYGQVVERIAELRAQQRSIITKEKDND